MFSLRLAVFRVVTVRNLQLIYPNILPIFLHISAGDSHPWGGQDGLRLLCISKIDFHILNIISTCQRSEYISCIISKLSILDSMLVT